RSRSGLPRAPRGIRRVRGPAARRSRGAHRRPGRSRPASSAGSQGMSGVFGIVDFAALRVEPEAFRRLAESAMYRAPGGIGYQFLGEAGLAYLALHADPRGLAQPLLDRHRQVCALFDGRLDNRPELIARLVPADGADASDTALLLAAYGEWGEACTDHLL